MWVVYPKAMSSNVGGLCLDFNLGKHKERRNCIFATIGIGREIQCLPYAVLFFRQTAPQKSL